jgi:hypothetical protein
MKRTPFPAATALLAFALAAAVTAQEMPPLPKPGPEHEVLMKDVGTWDATVEMFAAPGAPASVSKGTETVSMLGGFWQVTRFKSEMMGQPFEGMGTTGFDPAKKKYVGTWVDSMTPGLSTSEGSYDPATQTFTGMMEGPDMTGKVTRMRETVEWKDPDTRVFTMYAPKAADGKEPVAMRITYKRRK